MKTVVTSVQQEEGDAIMFKICLGCGHFLRMCERDVDLTKVRAGRAAQCFRCDPPKGDLAGAVGLLENFELRRPQ
jgi:hypothetical protein